MTFIEAIILGLVQGLTEFLPVSSSGHLALASIIMGTKDADLFFDTLLHLGTLCAVIFAYRKTIWRLIVTFFTSIIPLFKGELKWKTATKDQRMIVFVIISLLPLFLILPFKDTIERLSESVLFVGIALMITSAVLFLCDRITAGKKTAENMTVRNALTIGAVQMIAVFPGISRSGSTITAGVACGLDRTFAAEFSFIMSIPTILASLLLQVVDIIGEGGIDSSLILPYICGTVVAAVSGFFAIKLLELLLKSKKFIIFSVYCLIVGLFAIVWSFIQLG